MRRDPYAKINDTIIFTVFPETKEEAEKHNFPLGIHVAYEINGELEFSAGVTMQRIIKESRTGTIHFLQNAHNLRKSLIDNQAEQVVSHLLKMKKDYIESNQPREVIYAIDTQIQKYAEGIKLKDNGVCV